MLKYLLCIFYVNLVVKIVVPVNLVVMIGVKIDSLLRTVMIVDEFLIILLKMTVSVIWSFNSFVEMF